MSKRYARLIVAAFAAAGLLAGSAHAIVIIT